MLTSLNERAVEIYTEKQPVLGLYEVSGLIKISIKSGDQGARTASFGIIRHQMPNWE
jgi:hypothetical protein